MMHLIVLYFYCLGIFGLTIQNSTSGNPSLPEYGICTQTCIAVRGEKSHTSEQVTQLVFGDVYVITAFSETKDWVFIKNAYDGYEGWIPVSAVFEVSEKYYLDYMAQPSWVAASHDSYVLIHQQKIKIPIGSTLPYYEAGFILIDDKRIKFEGTATHITRPAPKSVVLATARSYLGSPYLWGGKTTQGIDCSGFTQMVFKQHGYVLPRDSYQQAEIGQKIALTEAKAGDIAFFQRNAEGNTKVVHVGIYLGNGQIIHADGRVRINRLDATGIYREDLGKYSHYLKFLRRLEE